MYEFPQLWRCDIDIDIEGVPNGSWQFFLRVCIFSFLRVLQHLAWLRHCANKGSGQEAIHVSSPAACPTRLVSLARQEPTKAIAPKSTSLIQHGSSMLLLQGTNKGTEDKAIWSSLSQKISKFHWPRCYPIYQTKVPNFPYAKQEQYFAHCEQNCEYCCRGGLANAAIRGKDRKQYISILSSPLYTNAFVGIF